ncbi:MAG TPA: hypothetical protein VK801_04430 [Caulobacteraceae bacterium]|jgi:hypothetical protein|nr:hypothetical protein [Caulobacteraceae bacterium]
MIRIIPVVMAGALSFSGAAFAQTPPTQASDAHPMQASDAHQTQAKAPAPKADPSQEVVCRRQDVPGSRLGGEKICHTRAEWDEMSRVSRAEVERAQTTVRTPN